MAKVLNHNEIVPAGLEGDSSPSNDLVNHLSNPSQPANLESQINYTSQNNTQISKARKGSSESNFNPSDGQDQEQVALAEREEGQLENGELLEDRMSVRQYATKRPQAFKPVSTAKSFLAKSGSGLSSPLRSATERASPVTPGLSGSRPRLVAKVQPPPRSNATVSSGPDAQDWRSGAGPDPKDVWNKNRVAAAKPMRALTDEEMIKHGIHLTARLQREGPNKESDWADLSDDEDDWTAPPIKIADGPSGGQLAGVRRDGKMPRAHLKPTVVPLPSGKKPDINGKFKGVSSLGSSRLGSLMLKGATESKPATSIKPIAMASPLRSPWAALPPVSIVSPANPATENELGSATTTQTEQSQSLSNASEKERLQVSADDFHRHGVSAEPSSTKELFNSTSGQYESVDRMRRMSKTYDQGYRQPAVLHRSSESQGGPSGMSQAYSLSRVQSGAAAKPAAEHATDGTQVVTQSDLRASSIGAQTGLQGSGTEDTDPVALQMRIMQESRALARKRKEQEEKEEAEKRDRIARKLAEMDANAQRQSQPGTVADSSIQAIATGQQPETGSYTLSNRASEQPKFSSSELADLTHQSTQSTHTDIRSDGLLRSRISSSPLVNGNIGGPTGTRSYSPLDVGSRSQSSSHAPNVAMPLSNASASQASASPALSMSGLNFGSIGTRTVDPFARSGNTPSASLGTKAFDLPRQQDVPTYRQTGSRFFPSKNSSANTQGAPGLSQSTNPIAPPVSQSSPWPPVPASRFAHWNVSPQNLVRSMPTGSMMPPPPTEEIWIKTISGPGAIRIRAPQLSTSTPESSLRGLNHYDIPDTRPSPPESLPPADQSGQQPTTVPVRGSRFFPTAAFPAEIAPPIQEVLAQHGSSSLSNLPVTEQTVFDSDTPKPRVQLPPQRPVVKLPPSLDDQPSLTSEHDTEPSTVSSIPPDDHDASMDWQAKFSALMGRPNPASTAVVKPIQASPSQPTAIAVVTLPGASAASNEHGPQLRLTPAGPQGVLILTTKDGSESLMVEQQFGSTPPVKLPVQVQQNAWAKQIVFHDVARMRTPAVVDPVSAPDSSLLLTPLSNPSKIVISLPGSTAEELAKPSSAPKPSKPHTTKHVHHAGKRGPPRRPTVSAKPRTRTAAPKPQAPTKAA